MTVAADGGAAAAGGVSVAWHSTATREAAGQAAGKLIADGVPSALAARDPGLWGGVTGSGLALDGVAGSGLALGPGAAGGPARLGWLDAPRASRALLGVNPFDYPGVVAATQETARLLAGAGPPPAGVPAFTEGAVDVYAEPGLVPASGGLAEVLDTLLLALPDRGYLAVMAYLDRDGDRAVTALRDALAARTTHPVTFGWGPRLLHSTGQYHRGGPQNGVFLQITGALEDDVDVPGRDFTLGGLQLAQALGDLGALRQRGRPAIRIHLRDRAAGVSQLLDSARASTNGAAP